MTPAQPDMNRDAAVRQLAILLLEAVLEQPDSPGVQSRDRGMEGRRVGNTKEEHYGGAAADR